MDLVKSSRYNLPYRRRREGKTDYRMRMKYILSGQTRFVVRPSNEHTLVQVVEARVEGDKMLASAYSKELNSKYGWRGSCGNIPSAYLTGFLAGVRALKGDVTRAALDIGLRRATKGARVFAALKGGVDAGLGISHGEEVLPSVERVRGEHIARYAELLSSTPELYKRMFSLYLGNGLKPQDIPAHFDEVKAKIEKEFQNVRDEA